MAVHLPIPSLIICHNWAIMVPLGWLWAHSCRDGQGHCTWGTCNKSILEQKCQRKTLLWSRTFDTLENAIAGAQAYARQGSQQHHRRRPNCNWASSMRLYVWQTTDFVTRFYMFLLSSWKKAARSQCASCKKHLMRTTPWSLPRLKPAADPMPPPGKHPGPCPSASDTAQPVPTTRPLIRADLSNFFGTCRLTKSVHRTMVFISGYK